MKLKEWLKLTETSQSQLAKHLNITPSLIWMWAKKKRAIGPKTLLLLIDATDGLVTKRDEVID